MSILNIDPRGKRFYQGDAPHRRAIRPGLWGPTVWDALHFVSIGYPERDPPPEIGQAAYDLLFSLQHLLPCHLCRQHLSTLYQTSMPLAPSVFQGQRDLGDYLVRLRDEVECRHVTHRCIRHGFDRDVLQRLLYPRKWWWVKWVLLMLILWYFLKK